MNEEMIQVWFDQMVKILDQREFSQTEFHILRQMADKASGKETAPLKDEIILMWWLAELRFADDDISKIDLSWSKNLKGDSDGNDKANGV